MDKRYYSEKHKRNIKKRHYSDQIYKRNDEKNTFILRLNICLGIAIIAVGTYKLNGDIADKMTDGITSVLSQSTSVQSIKSSAVAVFNFVCEGKNIGLLANIGEDVALDKETLESIAENENAYYKHQKALESP